MSPPRWRARFAHAACLLALSVCADADADAAAAQTRIDAGEIRPADALFADRIALTGAAVCGVDDDWPLHTWRELYFSRQRSMACTDAVVDLETFNEKNDLDVLRVVRGNATARKIAERYSEKCLVSFSSVSDPNGGYAGSAGRDRSDHLTWMSSEAEVERLRKSIGSLTFFRDAHCSATLVSFGDGRAGLLTAMHCLDPARSPDANSQLRQPYPELTFKSISGDTVRLGLGNGFSGIEYDLEARDAVILPIPVDDPSRYLPLARFGMDLWEPLLIFGVNPYLAALAHDADDLAESVAVSMEPYCMLMARSEDGRIHHLCQTEEGQSGSAVLALRDKAFHVAAIHSYGDTKQRLTCAEGATPTLNAGVAIIDPSVK